MSLRTVSVLLCLLFALNVEAQVRKKQTPVQPTKINPTKQQGVKEYKQGETYSLDDVVNLNTEGNKFTVELVHSNEGTESKGISIKVKIRILGKFQAMGFTFGQEASDIALVANQKRIAASRAYFTEEVVASTSEPVLVSHMRTAVKDGLLVLDTNEHPLVLEFQVPDELSKATKQLELKGFMLGGQKYSLIVRLDNLHVVESQQREIPTQARLSDNSISGDWEATLSIAGKTGKTKLRITLEGERAVIEGSGPDGTTNSVTGTWIGNELSITQVTPDATTTMTATLQGEKLTGDISVTVKDGSHLTGKWEANRIATQSQQTLASSQAAKKADMTEVAYQRVSNGTYELQVIKVERTPSLDGIRPRDPNNVFVSISFETNDLNVTNVQGPLNRFEAICGELKTASGQTYQADGGGLRNGKPVCNFIVHQTAAELTFYLRGYPGVKLQF